MTVHGVACRHWTAQEGDSVLHLYVDKNLLGAIAAPCHAARRGTHRCGARSAGAACGGDGAA